MIEIDWDEFLDDDGLSLEEERNTTVAVSEYLATQEVSTERENVEKLITRKKIKHVSIEMSVLPTKIEHNPIYDRNELIDFLNNETFRVVNPVIPFPKIKSLSLIFSFIQKLVINLEDETVFRFYFSSYEELEIKLLNSLAYFGYLQEVNYDGMNVYLPTSTLFEIRNETTKQPFVHFIEQVIRHKVIKECLMVQCYSESFDIITKDIIKKKLREDLSILNENLSESELHELMHTMRRWYIEIKNSLLKR